MSPYMDKLTYIPYRIYLVKQSKKVNEKLIRGDLKFGITVGDISVTQYLLSYELHWALKKC